MKTKILNWMSVLIVVLLAITSVNNVIAQVNYITLDKTTFEQGEVVQIKFLISYFEDVELSIRTTNRNYQYNGEILSQINFLPQETGLHKILLLEKGTNNKLQELEFEVINSDDDSTAETSVEEVVENIGESILLTDKSNYYLGETAIINSQNAETLRIIYLGKIYTFKGSNSEKLQRIWNRRKRD